MRYIAFQAARWKRTYSHLKTDKNDLICSETNNKMTSFRAKCDIQNPHNADWQSTILDDPAGNKVSSMPDSHHKENLC